MAGNKLVKEVDEKVWRQFMAYCVLRGVKAGPELTNILEQYLKGKIK